MDVHTEAWCFPDKKPKNKLKPICYKRFQRSQKAPNSLSLSIVRFTNLTPIEAGGCCLACCNMAVKQRDTEDGRTHTIEINVCREWCRRRESREREQAIEEVESGRK